MALFRRVKPPFGLKTLVKDSNCVLIQDPSVLSSMFSDRAGTVPVSGANDVVGKILDLSGKGNHATAPSDAARPVLKLDGNGRWYLERDLVDDTLAPVFSTPLTDPVAYGMNQDGTWVNYALDKWGTTSTDKRKQDYGLVVFNQPTTQKAENFIIKTTYQKSLGINPTAALNDIGVAGSYGFGVGICPNLPAGFVGMTGFTNPLSSNYGNYQYLDGSVMVWIPAFYYSISVNTITVKPYSAYADVAAANAAGFALHRAFYDGGAEQPGFFVDKYQWSANSYSGNTIASSIKNGNPLSSNSAHNPWGSLTGLSAGDNIYAGAIPAAKTRGATFACISRFQWSALAMLSLAHAQGSVSATYCAWWATSGVVAPRGCDNNALASTDDTAVKWQSDGYSNAGKTGSAGYGGGAGNIFAKSTHNGQNCGVADLCGNMWEVSLGMTCIASAKTISGATQANPCVVTATGHGYATGDVIQIDSVVGMTQLNGRLYTITKVDDNSFSLDGINATGFTAYSSAGTATRGKWYAAKSTVRMRNFTAGTSLATDHWGATGVAAMMDEIAGTGFLNTTVAANAVYDRRWGNGAAAAFRGALSGSDWTLDGLALCTPGAVAGGASLFGSDYYYQYVRDRLCPVSGGYWSNATGAGVWALHLYYARTSSDSYLGARSGLYIA